jgi:hypothetical protein
MLNEETDRKAALGSIVLYKKNASVYKENGTDSTTIKMHLLFAHLESRLLAYGTVSFFVEDSMESIHVMVNRLSRVYSSLDGECKTCCIIKSITAAKQQSLAVQSNNKMKEEKEKSVGREMDKKRR